MARRERRTAPIKSKHGILETYEEQEPHLIEAEWRGRQWAFEQAASARPLSDTAIFDLHKAMFADLLEWAGLPRTEDVGPGGKVAIPLAQVREALRNFGDDFSAWLASAGTDPTLDQLASIRAVSPAHASCGPMPRAACHARIATTSTSSS